MMDEHDKMQNQEKKVTAAVASFGGLNGNNHRIMNLGQEKKNDASHNSRTTLKKGIDFDSARKRRSIEGIQIRKRRRDEGILRRRAIQTVALMNENTFTSDDVNTLHQNGNVNNVPSFLSHFNHIFPHSVLQLITNISINNHDSASTNINVTTKNISSHNNLSQMKDLVAECGIVPYLVQNLHSTDIEIRTQSALCIGNIAGETSELRDYVLDCGVIEPILENINNFSSNDKLVETFVWAISNICRGKQSIHMNYIIPVFPTLIHLIHTSQSDQIIINACWAFTYLTEDNDTVCQTLVQRQQMQQLQQNQRGDDLTSKFVLFLNHANTDIIYVALRLLGNLILGGFINDVIDAGVISHVHLLLKNHDSRIRNETYYFLSLIAGSGKEYIDTLLTSPSSLSGLKIIICEIMQNALLSERLEAMWIIFTIAKNGSDRQLQSLVDLGTIPALCYNLNVPDIKFTLLVLDSIENCLLVGDRLGLDYKGFVEECGGRDGIESLLSAENDSVYRKSNEIYEEFFEKEEEQEEDYTYDWDQDWR